MLASGRKVGNTIIKHKCFTYLDRVITRAYSAVPYVWIYSPAGFSCKIKIKNEFYTSKHALYDGIGLRISKHNLPCVFVISK